MWLLDKTQSINWGYIMKAGSGDKLLYFVYDGEKEYGRHYNASGKPTEDNPKLKDWVIVYQWPQTKFMFTPKGLVPYMNIAMPDRVWSRKEGIDKGYILMPYPTPTTTTKEFLYYFYDEDKDNGKYYDAQGNPAQNNPKLKDWTIIYKWDPSCGLFTPLGWVTYMLVSKENLHSWLCTMTESIPKGYILMGGFPRRYYVYDEDKECGQYYDAQGNPLEDNSNSKFISGVIIYKWEPAV